MSVEGVVNVGSWIEENASSFLPPVCNKLLHGHGQIKVMFIGGPNIRRDFHINEGEELFYQIKGDMILKTMQHGKPTDIPIKEGEIFLLPGRIPHSPQRYENTVGLVLERHRLKSETDGLRYYQQSDPTQPLWERWFYCHDLGSQLGPVIKEYFASKEHETDTPTEENLTTPPPVELDTLTDLSKPFSLQAWLDDHKDDIATKGSADIFSKGEFQMKVFGNTKGEPHQFDAIEGQTWLWQKTGKSTVTVGDQTYELDADGSLLVEPGNCFTLAVPVERDDEKRAKV